MATSFPSPISNLAEILNKRNIPKEQAVVLGLGAVSPEEAMEHLGYRAPGQISYMEALPYFDADGHPLGEPQFFRYRINYKEGWVPPEGKWENYPKYRSPRRKGEYAYLPRGVGIDWTAVHGNPEEPVILTEGEYKAIATCKTWGLPCIGFGGVWMFYARKDEWPEGFDLQIVNRKFYIVYDADRESTVDKPLKGGKSGVEGAANRLSVKLFSQGGDPTILYIARTSTFLRAREKNPEAKMGLDDFIEAGGTWEELLAHRNDPVRQAGLAYLLDTYAMYRGDKVGILNTKTGNMYSVKDFKDVEANCKETVAVEKGGKIVPTIVRYAPLFVEHDDRPDFYSWIFEPSSAPGLDQSRGTYNRWKGMAVEGWVGPGEMERYREVIGIWRKFTEGLAGTECRDYFERWVADIFQYPGRKTTIAVLLRTSLNGVGKSLLGEVIRDIVGPTHSARLGLGDVTHHFNSLLGDRIMVQVDEANDIKKEHDGQLKDLISAEETRVTLKNRDSVIVKNYARLFITSNSVSPIVLDEHNRRVYVLNPQLTVADQEGEWSKWVRDVVAPTLRSAEGLRMLRFHLDQVDLSEWIPTAHVPKTEAMLDIVEASASRSGELLGQVWADFLADPEGVWVVGGRITATPDAKLLWTRFKDKIKNTGGQTLSHVMKMPGEKGAKRVRVFVRAGLRLPSKHVPDQGQVLESSGVEGGNEWLLGRLTAAERSVASWEGITASGKY